MRLAYDTSSILWNCLLGGKDPQGYEVENELGVKVHINTAPYGYEFVVNSVLAVMKRHNFQPKDSLFVCEGLNTKFRRLAIDQKYKSNREARPIQQYDEFNKLQNKVIETFRTIGVTAMVQDQAEGDDTLGWLAINTREDLTIFTHDNDMSVLSGVNQHGAKITVNVSGVIDDNKYGEFPKEYITIYKALVGDSGDKISGIPGFGVKAWQNFHIEFGLAGMAEMQRLAEYGSLDELYNESLANKMVQKIFDGREDFLRSYQLAKLHPEWVNTMQNPIQWLPGMCRGKQTDERLKPYQASRRLVTATNWEEFKPWAARLINAQPTYALDIETSTPDESDEWLAAQELEDGVDVIGSELTGMSLTFGPNDQYTVYISVAHKDTENVASSDLRDFIASLISQPVIHNTAFEGPVLYQAWGSAWLENGYHGFLPNWLDTKMEASYVDENNSIGLKKLSKRWFQYDQVEYLDAVKVEGKPDSLYNIGRFGGIVEKEITPARTLTPEEVSVFLPENTTIVTGPSGENIYVVPAVTQKVEIYILKMKDHTAQHVFDYASDDTMCTAAFHNFAKLFMQLEGTWDTYLDVEIDSSYLHAQSFVDGADVSMAKLSELKDADQAEYDQAETALHSYLIQNGWDGTICPVFEKIDAAAIKAGYEIVFGNPLKTMIRTPSKLLELVSDNTFKQMVADVGTFNAYIKQHFKAKPVFNVASPTQKSRLFYEVMKLPVKVYNKPTDKMKSEGNRIGTPKSDNLAITYALLDGTPEQVVALKAVQVMQMVNTRMSLYYEPYPAFVHWKTGKIHSSHNQCGTNTRRASSAKPNLQQMSKHEKVVGFSPRVREVIVPHRRDAVIVSFDFKSQEILLMAEQSRDPELVGLFVGETRKDMHSITGVGILRKTNPELDMSYDTYVEVYEAGKTHELFKYVGRTRHLGKQVNFGSQYRIAAKKLSNMLMVTEADAQVMLDAKAEAFPVAEQWSQDQMALVKQTGVVRTLMGAIRHLGALLMSDDFSVASKADRQAISFLIQGSAAEQTKMAEGRMWAEGLRAKYDMRIIAPVHDEVVFSIRTCDLEAVLPIIHRCMVANYGNMTLPIESSISFGPNFGQQVEIGMVPSPEAIAKGLTSMNDKHMKVAA